ncbi:hypothetical protein ACO11K_001550 [Bacillus cytotoxicus]
MKEKQKVDKRESLTKECKKLLVELFVRAKTDERVQHFLDDFGEFLKKKTNQTKNLKRD